MHVDEITWQYMLQFIGEPVMFKLNKVALKTKKE